LVLTDEAQGMSPGSSSLKEKYGEFVELGVDGETAEAYRIVAELTVAGIRYAILQSEAMRREDDIEVFRITTDAQGDVQLETVDDDDEWDRAAEAFDDLQFGSDEQP
jgi:uncharacterized protein YrzB (UPF0473 family)